MEPIESIRAHIGNFAGYEDERQRRMADEQIRAFVGERLAALPAVDVDTLPVDERARYDRILLRCEFLNQQAFHVFEGEPTQSRIAMTLEADIELIAVAKELPAAENGSLNGVLERLENAFDRRDSAMTGA